MKQITVTRHDLARRLAIRARRLADDMHKKFQLAPDYADYEEAFLEEIEALQETAVTITDPEHKL